MVTRSSAPGAPDFGTLEAIAGGRAGVAILAAWGFAEALVLPVVPDVLLYLLVAIAPRRTAMLFAASVIGALVGTAILYTVATARPEFAASIVLAVPGIDPLMVDAARRQVSGGDPLSLAAFGPGTPLKAYTVAWASGAGTMSGLVIGTVLNRITRIGPGLLIAAAVGVLAPRWLRRHQRLILLAYLIGWTIVYAVYLS